MGDLVPQAGEDNRIEIFTICYDEKEGRF